MKKFLVAALLVALAAGVAGAGGADSDDTTEALRKCQFQTAMASSWLGPREDLGTQEAKESRKYILALGRRAAQGDYVSYECAIKYINDTHGSRGAQMLKDTMTLEQNRLMLSAAHK